MTRVRVDRDDSNRSSRVLDALDGGSDHALLETGAHDGARRVRLPALLLTRRLSVLATATIDGVDDGDKPFLIRADLELDLALAKGVQGEIFPRAHAVAGVKLRETRNETWGNARRQSLFTNATRRVRDRSSIDASTRIPLERAVRPLLSSRRRRAGVRRKPRTRSRRPSSLARVARLARRTLFPR